MPTGEEKCTLKENTYPIYGVDLVIISGVNIIPLDGHIYYCYWCWKYTTEIYTVVLTVFTVLAFVCNSESSVVCCHWQGGLKSAERTKKVQLAQDNYNHVHSSTKCITSDPKSIKSQTLISKHASLPSPLGLVHCRSVGDKVKSQHRLIKKYFCSTRQCFSPVSL